MIILHSHEQFINILMWPENVDILCFLYPVILLNLFLFYLMSMMIDEINLLTFELNIHLRDAHCTRALLLYIYENNRE